MALQPHRVSIETNTSLIEAMLLDLVLKPRRDLIRWAKITKQTPHLKIGYIGQHLASLVTGVEGSRTGARGHDLRDRSEVKSCSRVDQLDKCKSCGAAVARLEHKCPKCGSESIKRNNDSKWLLAVKNEDELRYLLNETPRTIFILTDYPYFDAEDWTTLQFQVFEIWPGADRHTKFRELMDRYYHNIYLPHIERNPRRTPAPKNFWPYSYQFYLCNPICVFRAIVYDALSNPSVNVLKFVEPLVPRSTVDPDRMPIDLLTQKEVNKVIDKLGKKTFKKAAKVGLTEGERRILNLRKTDVATPQSRVYQRGSRS